MRFDASRAYPRTEARSAGASRPFHRVLAVAGLALFATVSLSSCYRVRITEQFWLQPRPGPAADSARVADGLPGDYALTPVAIPVGPGIQLVGVAATTPGARATILYFGGDDFVVADQAPTTLHALTASAPVNVVLVDYPGTGASGGHPTLATLKAYALTTYDWVTARPDLAPHGVVVHGHSLGSFVAAAVAAARPVRGLVLQNAATTPADWLHAFFRPSRLKWWARPAYPFLRFTLAPELAGEDNVARVRQFRGPLLLLSGSADTKAAPAMSRALMTAAASPDSLKWLMVLPGSGHDDVLTNPGFAPAYAAFVRVVAGAAQAR